MSKHLINAKTSLIEYLLFLYEFKSRISVWVLNLLKASPDKLSHLYFVDHIVSEHNTLEIATQWSHHIGIVFKINGNTLIDSNEIFEIIANDNVDFDIKIHFEREAQRPMRYDEVLMSQLLYSPSYNAYIQDINDLTFSPQHEKFIINYLKDNIDLSLQLNDRAVFYQLSHILNQFKLKNMNTSDIGGHYDD